MEAVRRIVRALSASARRTGRGRVSGAQAFVLRQIGAAPGLSLGELAARTLARQSTVSEVVARLVDRGLVTRGVNRDDARQVTLRLTGRGRHVLAPLAPTAQEQLRTGLGALATAERAALARTLERWLAAAGLAGVPATMFFETGARTARPGEAGSPGGS
jgi:DNA-binding MarR family transcriptional regulator